MNSKIENKRKPLQGTQTTSTIATGGAGGVFQTRVGALYLANMLTGLPTTNNLNNSRVEELRFEARYTGVHTDDIYCNVRRADGIFRQFIQCKRGLNAIISNVDFVDSLEGAWRDFLGIEGSPFDRSKDQLILATIAPATSANQVAKRLCELTRASVDLADFLLKLMTPKLLDKKHKEVWEAFKHISQKILVERYSDELVFQLLRSLRVDIYDLANDMSQEISLVQALLKTEQIDQSGELIWYGLVSYVAEQGISLGTVTRATWASTANNALQQAVSRVESHSILGNFANRLSTRSHLQLSLISTTLPNGIHIPRGDSVASVLSCLEKRQLAIIAGGPGAGKSAIIASLAPILQESGPLLFFRAEELNQPSLGAVQSLSGFCDPLLSIASLLQSGTPIVIIDSLEKALEARNSGALEELLALVKQNRGVKLCITTRSYALNPLYTNFLANFVYQIIDIKPLTDSQISFALRGNDLEEIVVKDAVVREVLRAPYYLRLALDIISNGKVFPMGSGNDLRRMLWTERIAPNRGLPTGMPSRRQMVFDQVCLQRTESFSQFIEAPADSEAVVSLLNDGLLVKDSSDRVAPAHDVLEDWSLFFRVEREVRSSERNWDALFVKLGSHAGMRRALRTWTAQRSAEGDTDAYSLLESTLKQELPMGNLWHDEVAIGLLRSDEVAYLITKLANTVSFDSAKLLNRLTHLTRVACKGPTNIDYTHLVADQSNKEFIARIAMAAPIGKAWDVLIDLVAIAFPTLPCENHSWVIQFIEDAIAHDVNFFTPSTRLRDIYSIAEYYCSKDIQIWHGSQTIGKRYFAVLCKSCGANLIQFKAFIETLLVRLTVDTDIRDIHAEQRLKYLINFKHSREPSYFTPDLVCRVFLALYTTTKPSNNYKLGDYNNEVEFGLNSRATHEFFPPSVLQGPFRWLLQYSSWDSVSFVIKLCNHAAKTFANINISKVTVLPPELSPNERNHIHEWSLWTAYRGHSVTSNILTSALMSLEEYLLISAKNNLEFTPKVIEFILDNGDSSFTTGLVAGVLTAYPKVVTQKMLTIFKYPGFFVDDIARCVREGGSLAILGGNDGLDSERQKERAASNKLPHRLQNIETLALKLQFDYPEHRETIFTIIDKHKTELVTSVDITDSWRMILKRIDIRGLKLGETIDDGNLVTLEINNLEPELKLASNKAEARIQIMYRLSKIISWSDAITGDSLTNGQSESEYFKSPTELYNEFLQLKTEYQGQEAIDFEIEIACALYQRWPHDNSPALQWSKSYILETTACQEDRDTWVKRCSKVGEVRAHTLILLASIEPTSLKIIESLANIVTEPAWNVRRAAAKAICALLRPCKPELAEMLTTALAQFAEKLSILRKKHHDIIGEARNFTVESLLSAFIENNTCVRPIPSNLIALDEWTIAIEAARNETYNFWKIQSLTIIVRLLVDREKNPSLGNADRNYGDFGTPIEIGDLFASELLILDKENSQFFELFDYCLEHGPELSAIVLESTLYKCIAQEFANANAFWRIWRRAVERVLPDDTLKIQSKQSYSRFDKILRVLLFTALQWPKDCSDLPLFDTNSDYISQCLNFAGKSRPILENLLCLMASVGKVRSIPHSLPKLRDALNMSPSDIFDDGNCVWYAETICRVAVHDHRETLIRDVIIRKATIDILNLLVEAGSSYAFQLRDYLAASPH